MKKMSTVLKFAIVPCLVLLIVAAGLPGIVLCIGRDGHVSIESARAGQCSGEADTRDHASHEEPAFATNPDDDCCGDCTDVPLSTDGELKLVRHVRNSLSGNIQPQPSYLFDTACPFLARTRRITLHASPPRLPASIREQSTIVLRI